jgi:surfactin synthase thioesterase subunit
MSEHGVRLLCLPYAGGSVAVYHRLTRAMPPGVTVRPIELPGHGLRRGEPLIDSFDGLVDWVATHIRATVDGPYVLFGHSFGALLAFETARVVRDELGEPCALLVSGHNGPSYRTERPGIHALSDAELVAATGIWGGLPAELDAFPELRARSLRVLRTDLRLAETYRRRPGTPLSCPLTVFGGDADGLVDAAGLNAWGAETTGPTTVVTVPGGHLMVHDASFATLLGTQLSVVLGGLARVTTGGRAGVSAGG